MTDIPDPKQILLKVLDIIAYQDDKEKFSTEFLQLCMKKALVDLIESLPQDRQQAIQVQLTTDKTAEQVQHVLQQYFSQQQYLQQLQLATQVLFQDYIQTIMPTLTPEQKQNLQTYLVSIVPPDMLAKQKI